MGQITKEQDSRRVFIDSLVEAATQDPKICLIVPDVGFNYCEKFKERFPDRYFNLGVTETSVVPIAAGMALSGMKPYVYSMINFVLFRPGEMVRNCVVKHQANVKLIGVKGSNAYKFLGFSHNLLHDDEDINFCKNIGLDWIVATTNVDRMFKEILSLKKPVYVRL